jgi:hypothetical protein
LVGDEVGSFEPDATTRGRVTDEAAWDDDEPAGFVCDADLSRTELVPVDGEFERI